VRWHTLTKWVAGSVRSPKRLEWRRQGRGAAGKWRQNWRMRSQVGWQGSHIGGQVGPNRPALGPRRAAAKLAATAGDSMCARGRNRGEGGGKDITGTQGEQTAGTVQRVGSMAGC
jgi:hypothetical protein